MIVRPEAGGLLLVTQPEHARLAGAIAAAWRDGGLPSSPRRDEILLAAAEHDNGWQEADAEPSLDPVRGVPYDFLTAPPALKQQVWTRGIDRLAGRSAYAAALVARHAAGLLAAYRGEADWAPFFARLDRRLADLLARAACAPAEAAFETDYRFLYLADLISLAFCCGWRQPIDAHGYRLRSEGDRLLVDPDPFGGATVVLAVRARRAAARRFASSAELHRVLAQAPETTIAGVAEGVRTASESGGRRSS
ncbi:MAG TPA: DUF3891 family protein [Vicinamibacterales bacterium]|nr:DUF3891 family protein [Vicinamibacterales bacterium]